MQSIIRGLELNSSINSYLVLDFIVCGIRLCHTEKDNLQLSIISNLDIAISHCSARFVCYKRVLEINLISKVKCFQIGISILFIYLLPPFAQYHTPTDNTNFLFKVFALNLQGCVCYSGNALLATKRV
jgi:hypothetical protein